MRKDRFTPLQRSRLMARIKSKNTGFERKVFVELRRRGLKFHTHYSKVSGKPDIALPAFKRAVFLHSDFWHGWQFSRWEKVLPSLFWKEKIRKNRGRDKKVLRNLRRQGWKVMVVWQHQLKDENVVTIWRIVRFIRKG